MKEKDAKTIIRKITNDVMAAIESGSLGQWVKPWQSFGFPKNVKTKQQYGLLNTFWLTDSLLRFGFTYPAWATEKQWNSLGYSLREGEFAKTEVLYPCHVKFPVYAQKKHVVEGIEEEQEEAPLYYKSYLVHKTFSVLNIAQINIPENEYDLFVTKTIQNGSEGINQFVQSIDHNMEESGVEQASYLIPLDTIRMPKKTYFRSETEYWATYLHELGHWTGAYHRLNRGFSSGSRNYAQPSLQVNLDLVENCNIENILGLG
ncbi:ArdC-like ssDNA-binding domain-containing protein [Leptospira chreensis]|uniref:ArdC-like ssDNA-binding domain-containing protein n=1 Tax=Leptospira chreensis TaxID=2810035 RepID=UPI001E36E97B|nr:ArdC-like ssDNA-binding domain-containing protein [Leptospira chreensis]